MTQPLRSIPLSGTSLLLQVVPPLSLRFRTLALVVLPLVASPLASKSQVPTFRSTASLASSGHLSCRMPLRPYTGFAGADPAVTTPLRFRHRPYAFDTSSVVPLRSSSCQSPDLVLSRPFPSVLTTMAFDHSRRRWFGTCPCRPVPRGRPSSVKQLRATQSFLLSRSWRTVIGIADEINTRLSSGRLDSHLREPFSKELFKPVQCEISKRWGDNSTLRGSIHRFVKDVFLHVTRFQPFSKNGPVHWCTGQEPFVTDFVETTFDVTLEARIHCVPAYLSAL